MARYRNAGHASLTAVLIAGFVATGSAWAQTSEAASAAGAQPDASQPAAASPTAGPSNAASPATTGGQHGANAGAIMAPGGQTPPLPQLTPGVAGSAKMPVMGSVANAATADYPTDTTADYVFACMASNGDTRTALEQCSCSFDVVASLIPYDRYTEASTFLSMGQVAGEKGSLFRESEESKAAVGDLRRAQAEAEVRCFD